MDFSQILAQKIDTITKNWIEAVRQNSEIESADDLPSTAIEDHLPDVLQAIANVLSQSQMSEIQSIIENSLEHGNLRAAQGFEPTEIAREYHLLREVIFSVLEPQLLQAKPTEVLQTVRVIDATLDEAIAQCFKSYVEQRLKELDQVQSQLILNKQELNRLIRANQDNLSHLAHELKSPLTSIIGYSDMFLRLQRNKTEVRTFSNVEHIERVLSSGRYLLRLINDALEISRYEAGQMKLQASSTDVRKLIKDVVEMLQPLAGAKELQMKIDCDRAPEQVLTDALRLQQILTNLVSNAIRYTDTGTIQVTCQLLSPEKWELTVTDTGRGIAPEDQERIFDPYFQVSAANQPYLPNSTGLGLAIVSRLVTLLQGQIEVSSQLGVGSTFSVILPLKVRTAL